MKNLILAFSTNQECEDLLVFCKSIRSVYDENVCDVVIVTNRFESYFPYLSEYGIQFFSTVSEFVSPTSVSMKVLRRVVLDAFCLGGRLGFGRLLPSEARSAYRLLLEAWHHPHYARWFAYRRFLSLNRNYAQVLIADVRDVAFQAPFFGESRGRVSLYSECEPFGADDGFNTGWYRAAWGRKALQRAGGKLPICIGTIIGPADETYLMVQEIAEFFCRYPFSGVEQAVFNYMIVEGLMKTSFDVVENVDGEVATLSSEFAKSLTVVKDGSLRRAKDDSVIPIVHMYDRFEDTRKIYEKYVKS